MKSKEKQKDRGKDKKKNTKEKRIKNPRDNVKERIMTKRRPRWSCRDISFRDFWRRFHVTEDKGR